jgi:imidazolonepropionase-like amidohydrolase
VSCASPPNRTTPPLSLEDVPSATVDSTATTVDSLAVRPDSSASDTKNTVDGVRIATRDVVVETGPPSLVFRGGHVVGHGTADVHVKEGHIVGVVAANTPVPDSATIVDVTGKYLAPAFIDSHVHLSYLPKAAALADGGIAGAVDHAAPLSFFETSFAPLQVLGSGPMVTAVSGYPTQGWGANGYGIECKDSAEAEQAVTLLAQTGARLIKLPITGTSQLTQDALEAAVQKAHELNLPVSSHALSDGDAAMAAAVNADVLAHTPVQPLSLATIEAWKTRAVISSLKAFGGSANAVANLKALHAAGATILYGTDFGNSSYAGIDPAELKLMQEAGMDGQAILDAGTSVPATFWGLDELGAIAPGKAASLLVLNADPRTVPLTLAAPAAVYINGVLR